VPTTSFLALENPYPYGFHPAGGSGIVFQSGNTPT
jgi:hypothetical protein